MTNDDYRETDIDESTESQTGRPTRRTFLRAAAASGAVAGLGVATGQDDTPTEEGTETGTETEGTPQGDAGFFAEGPEVGVQTVAEGMVAPTDFAVAGEDGRYFVADQTGQLWLVTEDGRQEEPFIDISDRMVTLGEFNGSYADPQSAYDERGLLGVAVHPNYSENGLFYLHYSAPPNDETPEGWDHVEVVSEFSTSEDEGADPESERVLLEIQHPQYNHDAGPMTFGPDDYLYVPMGDGGGANDDMYGHVEDWYDENEGGNGQDVEQNMLGSILRIDVDNEGEDTPYAIPEDNPLDPEEFDYPEQYAWGFRNPFGIDFDSQGRQFVADAGQNLYEEASIVENGGNYGWNVKEGTHCFSTENPSDPPAECPDSAPDEAPYDGQELIDPIVEYPHQYEGEFVGITVIGGHFYENDTVPGLQGKYIFGDWTSDVERAEPAGSILAATDPEAGDGTPTAGTPTDGTPTDGTPTDETPTGTPEDGTATPEAGTPTDGGTGTPTEAEMAFQDGTETPTPEGETGTPTEAGTETTTGDGTETTTEPGKAVPGTPTTIPDDGDEDVTDVPREELWEMEKLVVAGGEFDYFVRQFGQDEAGEIYVLANRRGVPEGETGVVMQLVPPEEGETITPGGTATEEGTPTEGTPTGETPTEETPTNGTPTEEVTETGTTEAEMTEAGTPETTE